MLTYVVTSDQLTLDEVWLYLILPCCKANFKFKRPKKSEVILENSFLLDDTDV